jgi:hypothetical protein
VDALAREWPRIRGEIDAGRLAVVGLIRAAGLSPWLLTRNHQVLAYAYEQRADGIAIRVYDPNHPGRDDVVLEIRLAPSGIPGSRAVPLRERITMRQSTGEPLLGFFVQPYPPPRSVRAWR